MRLFFILLLAPMAAVALDLTDQQRADIEALSLIHTPSPRDRQKSRMPSSA